MENNLFKICMDPVKFNNRLGENGFIAIHHDSDVGVICMGSGYSAVVSEKFKNDIRLYYPEVLRELKDFSYAMNDMSKVFTSGFAYLSKQDTSYYKKIKNAKTMFEESRIKEEHDVEFKNYSAFMSKSLKEDDEIIMNIRERLPEESYVLLLEYYSLLSGNFSDYIKVKTYSEIIGYIPNMEKLEDPLKEIKSHILDIDQDKLSEPVNIEEEFDQREKVLRKVHANAGAPIISYGFKDIGNGHMALFVQEETNFTTDQMVSKLTGVADSFESSSDANPTEGGQ